LTETGKGLAELIEKGGVYFNVEGNTPRKVLNALIKSLSLFPSTLSNELLEAVIEREELRSTSIGGGIAVPHPRQPIIETDDEQFVAYAFLKEPVDWYSLDGERVDTLLLIVSSSVRQHLQTMSEVSFFSRQEEFRRLLKKRAPLEELMHFIREAEKNWR
jgi:PTS system nitrogen regulatory IIA component